MCRTHNAGRKDSLERRDLKHPPGAQGVALQLFLRRLQHAAALCTLCCLQMLQAPRLDATQKYCNSGKEGHNSHANEYQPTSLLGLHSSLSSSSEAGQLLCDC